VVIGEWSNGKIEGSYCMFKPNIIGDGKADNQYEGLCQYGTMSSGFLTGENFIYKANGIVARSFFVLNQIG
jgi:hypothetical protein